MVGLEQEMSSSPNRGSRVLGANSRPTSKDGAKKNIWSSLLDSVANGKRLPEKNLLVLGTSSYLPLLASAQVSHVVAGYSSFHNRRHPGEPKGVSRDILCRHIGRSQLGE